MIKLIRAILKNSKFMLNNKGIVAAAAPAIAAAGPPGWLVGGGLMLGSSLLGGLFGKKKKKSEGEYFVDPYIESLRPEYAKRSDPSYYNFSASPVETQTGTNLLGRLNRSREDIIKQYGPEAATPYYNAAKTRMGETFGEEQAFAKDLYQREGVLTSTPGVQGQIDLKRKQGQEMEEFSQRLMYEDLSRELEATKMAEDIMSGDITQGMTYGNLLRGYQEKPYQYSNEMLRASAGLGGQQIMPTQEGGGLASELGKTGIDLSTLLFLSQIYGGGKTTPTTPKPAPKP